MRYQNKKGIFQLIFVVAFVLIVTPVFGQELPVVKWPDVETLLDQHPAILTMESEVEAAKYDIRRSRQYPNPEVGASYGIGEAIEGDESATIWGLEVEIPIDKPGTYINEARAAKANWKAVKSEAIMTERNVVRRIKVLFYRAAIGWERVDSLLRSRNQMKQLVETAELRVKHGEAPPTELTRLEIEFEKVDTDYDAAKQELAALRKRLNIWLGDKLPTEYRPQVDLTNLPQLPSLKTALSSIETDHPELVAANQRVQVADSNLGVERNRLFPEFRIGGFYDRELDAENYGGMISMELPLWNWNVGGVKRAKSERSAAKFRKIYIQRKLIDSVQEAHSKAVLLISRAHRYRDSIFPKAQETAKAHERLYQIGQTSVMDLLDSRRNLIETETEMQEAFLEGWRAYFNLITLIGENHA